MSDLIIDTPEGIELYRILVTYHGLKMEVDMTARGWPPTACPTRGRALASTKRILAQYKIPGPCGTRRSALRTMRAWLLENNFIEEKENNLNREKT